VFREFAAGETSAAVGDLRRLFYATAEAVTYKARGAGAPLFREFAAGEAAQRMALRAVYF
jgi:hypothetical protein